MEPDIVFQVLGVLHKELGKHLEGVHVLKYALHIESG